MRAIRRFAVLALAAVVCLAVAAGGIYLWAMLWKGSSQLARTIVWRDADVDDWKRFPSRSIEASTQPLLFEESPHAPVQWGNVNETVPFETFLEEKDTTSFIVLHRGMLLYENYFNGAKRDSISTSTSVAKSFASTLLGIAIGEGLISSLDDPVTDYLPELIERDARFSDITLRHLVTMSSGLKYAGGATPWSDPSTAYYSPNLRAAAMATTIVEAPGTRFHYNNYNPQLIGMVLEQVSGMSVSEYLETRLWQPIGAEFDASWSLDSEASGFELMQAGLNARPIDFAKLGWLFLSHGLIGERQVVPSDWVEEATRRDTSTDPAAEYQYFWWVDEARGAYYAEGRFCQFIYVYPRADLVLVRTGRDCGSVYWTGILGEVAVWLGSVIRD